MSSIKLRNIQKLVLDLVAFVACVCGLASVLASTANAQKTLESGARTGFVGRVGIGGEYLNHKAGASRLDGLIMSINGTLGWNWRDYAKLEFSAGFGAGTNNIYGAYPIGATQIGAQPLLNQNFNTKFKGGAFIDFGGEIKGGYNPISILKAWQYPLFINLGGEMRFLAQGATLSPYATTIFTSNLFVELDGQARLNQKWTLEYLARFFVAAGSISIDGASITQSAADLSSIISGYGLKFSLGTQYKMGKNAYFFTRLNLTYQNLSAGDTKQITISTNSTDEGINAGASANVRYPQSHTIYTGLQLGFGF